MGDRQPAVPRGGPLLAPVQFSGSTLDPGRQRSLPACRKQQQPAPRPLKDQDGFSNAFHDPSAYDDKWSRYLWPREAGQGTPTDWADKVRDAITNLETKTRRVLEPDQALALIDDVVEGKFAAGDLATIHGIPQESIRTTLGQITRAVGTGRGAVAHRRWLV